MQRDAHLVRCHLLASARTPPVAPNTPGLDYLVGRRVFWLSSLRQWEIVGWVGIIRASLPPVISLSGFWLRRIIRGILVPDSVDSASWRLMRWRILWRLFGLQLSEMVVCVLEIDDVLRFS